MNGRDRVALHFGVRDDHSIESSRNEAFRNQLHNRARRECGAAESEDVDLMAWLSDPAQETIELAHICWHADDPRVME